MKDRKFELILRQIAKDNDPTPEHVRQEMQIAMDMASPGPAVQAKWVAIPRKGKVLTLEGFAAYMTSQIPNSGT